MAAALPAVQVTTQVAAKAAEAQAHADDDRPVTLKMLNASHAALAQLITDNMKAEFAGLQSRLSVTEQQLATAATVVQCLQGKVDELETELRCTTHELSDDLEIMEKNLRDQMDVVKHDTNRNAPMILKRSAPTF